MSSESIEVPQSFIGPLSGEVKILVGVQKALSDRPGVLASARGLSHFGEHSLGWLGLAAAGGAAAQVRGDKANRNQWIAAGVGAFGAHAASVVIKRIVRRRRPHDPRIAIGVGTPSKLSFPSSHATSTTAAAILIGRAAGLPSGALPAALVPPMLLSRLVLGVHYPSDVIGGALIGATCAAAVTAGERLTRTEN
ncbi:MAG: PAP2 family protein [Gordonia sp.]|uniref:phosphatase PAP2 family protein n=1 Tax=Williamsia sp. 1138 TaxID=1903117 RepID=UPI000A11D5B7|nr:phosphatase PAP2 family protein [Williamsia sp. 1138]MBA4024939.1 PAP2 family protein [Gordonia sp. (in: high G+C Gram-positive bacteria)]OZG29001.1 phosphatase PAP2 family protein [Williamsia sp. 1138]